MNFEISLRVDLRLDAPTARIDCRGRSHRRGAAWRPGLPDVVACRSSPQFAGGVATQPATSESSKEKFYTMRRIITLALLALFCVAVPGAAYAQRLDGTLRITVTDKSGATRLSLARQPRRRSSSPADTAQTRTSTTASGSTAVAIPASTPASNHLRRCNARMHPAASGSAVDERHSRAFAKGGLAGH